MMTEEWLADIIIVNESRDETIAGNISVYRSAGEVCRALEHWWVEDGEGFAFTAAGCRLTLDVDHTNAVVVTARQQTPNGADVVRTWLRSSASALLAARTAKAEKGRVMLGSFEHLGQLPTTIEGLIAYIGFSR